MVLLGTRLLPLVSLQGNLREESLDDHLMINVWEADPILNIVPNLDVTFGRCLPSPDNDGPTAQALATEIENGDGRSHQRGFSVGICPESPRYQLLWRSTLGALAFPLARPLSLSGPVTGYGSFPTTTHPIESFGTVRIAAGLCSGANDAH